MSELGKILWLRVLVTALLVELALFAIVVPMRFLPSGFTIELIIVIPACIAAALIGGWWVARRAAGLYVLNGTLVGAVAALIYAALAWKQPLPAIFVVANYLKVLGGAVGGLIAARKWRRGTVSVPARN